MYFCYVCPSSIVSVYIRPPGIGFIHVDMDTTRSHLYWLNNRVPTNHDAYEYYDTVEKLQRAIHIHPAPVDWDTIVV